MTQTALPVFPRLPGVQFPVVKRASWDTIRLESVSGVRVAFPNRNVPRWTWELSMEFLRAQDPPWTYPNGAEFQSELVQLQQLFSTVQGSAYPFAYEDPTDGVAANQPIGTGNGSTSSFQLLRGIGSGLLEPVLVPTNVAVYVAGAKLSSNQVQVGNYGVVTLSVPPPAGAAITWTGNYQWLVRFDEDVQEYANLMEYLWECHKITFSSEIIPS